MYRFIYQKLNSAYAKQAPATGVGLFRMLFGLVTLQEVLFLLYFNHLIFDPIPYLDVEFPMIPFFLCAWAVIAFCLTIGYRCQTVSIANYLFWLVFVNFTPMQRDFDGGFDLFMIGGNLFLMLMPIDKAFSIDSLRAKLQHPFRHYSSYPKPVVSSLVYYLPVIICLGFLYLDSVIHKMFAEHWRNGLGSWLPSSIPYYISAIDFSWMLNQEGLQKAIGYTIIGFQFTFLFLFASRKLRPLFFLIGISLHLGIALSLNIYPFGLGMLIFYTLVMPFAWYRKLGEWLIAKQPRLTVFYDEQCPLCNRTVLILNHFDLLRRVDFKGAQSYAGNFAPLNHLDEKTLLTDLYALDAEGCVYAGVDTYAAILIAMGYCAPLGWILRAPLLHRLAISCYRRIADNRVRGVCTAACTSVVPEHEQTSLYQRLFEPKSSSQAKRSAHKITRVMIVLILLQLNSSIHYGVLYRCNVDTRQTPLTGALTDISNALLLTSTTFIGITPHALYLHDHFAGYNHLLALTYLDSAGQEHWLPFVNQQGRLLAPNWGRVHSMWANIAVTPNIDEVRLKKLMMKVTAFWGIKSGLDLDSTQFIVRMKKIESPVVWQKDLRAANLSGDWQAIGWLRWSGKEVTYNLPKDIDSL